MRAEAAAILDALTDEQLAGRLDAAVELAGAEIYLDRFVEAAAHAERALAVGRATGQGQLFPGVYATLGVAWCMVGRLADAAELLDAAIEAARLSGHPPALAWALFCRAFVAVPAGDLKTAIAAAQESLELADRSQPGRHRRPRRRRSWPSRCSMRASPTGPPPSSPGPLGAEQFDAIPAVWRAYLLELMTRCWLALGRRDEARRRRCRRPGQRRGGRTALGEAMASRATAAVALADGDAATAAQQALHAADLADAVGMPVEAAPGPHHRRPRAGRSSATETARSRAARAGSRRARPLRRRALPRRGRNAHCASSASTSTGAPGRATQTSGVSALTGRELEIAELIVDRKTNAEIARELFLSKKTVETHIRNMFRKLDANSRVDIARAVEKAGEG